MSDGISRQATQFGNPFASLNDSAKKGRSIKKSFLFEGSLVAGEGMPIARFPLVVGGVPAPAGTAAASRRINHATRTRCIIASSHPHPLNSMAAQYGSRAPGWQELIDQRGVIVIFRPSTHCLCSSL